MDAQKWMEGALIPGFPERIASRVQPAFAFWLGFLRSLVARGLKGVQLVVSDSHEGVKNALAAVWAGATWQRCRVHFIRNALAQVPKAAQSLVAATIRTIFAQPGQPSAQEQLRRVAEGLRAKFPKVSERLESAEADIPKGQRATAANITPAASARDSHFYTTPRDTAVCGAVRHVSAAIRHDFDALPA